MKSDHEVVGTEHALSEEVDSKQVSAQEASGGEPLSEEPGADGEGENHHPMSTLLEAASYDLEIPREGEIRSGTVARVTENDVLVDVGAKSEGVIPSKELERLSDEQRQELKEGEEISVYVLRSRGRDGTLLLSITRAEEEQDWRRAEQLLKSKELHEGTISGYNRGGLIVRVGQLRGFVPASQVSLSRRRRAQGESPEERWGMMVDEPIITRVIEVDRRRNRLILSERAGARDAREAMKERLIDELEPGEIRSGHVISLTDFGAFIDVGGADGLVHVSELSWKRVSHPRDVLEIGQEVKVKVLGVDTDRKRISLSLRALEQDPWEDIEAYFKEGQLVEGVVTKLTKFGAFARLLGGGDFDVEGLIHISELADQRIEHPREVVQEGQNLTLRIIKIDPERRRIGLSLRMVDSPKYTDRDWQMAMEEVESLEKEGISVRPSEEEMEDLDAALEEELGPESAEVTLEQPAENGENHSEKPEAEGRDPGGGGHEGD